MAEEKFVSGFVSLIGRPNVGKSTIMNKVIGQKIAITSAKPQTTRNRIQTVFTTEKGQIVFLDTPGIHKPKNKLGEYMMDVAGKNLFDGDIVVWIVEPSEKIGAGEDAVLELLEKLDEGTPVFLVINKTDTVKNEEILKVIDLYRSKYEFAEIIPVSGIKGDNIDTLIELIYKYLPEGPMYFDEETVTDQMERDIVCEIIREKSLHALRNEVPHGIAVMVESMKERKGRHGKMIMDIDAVIICERTSHKGIIIGKGGAMLKKIGSTSRYEIEEMLGCQANLKLFVKIERDWRDKDSKLKNFGYYED